MSIHVYTSPCFLQAPCKVQRFADHRLGPSVAERREDALIWQRGGGGAAGIGVGQSSLSTLSTICLSVKFSMM
jgi:hypothetical protein